MLLGSAVFLATMMAGRSAWAGKFEVWLLDQSNTNGLTYGGKVYIYDGKALTGKNPGAAVPIATIDLSTLGGASGLCNLATDPSGGGAGANPVRPHMIFFNKNGTHAWISFVASGHVAVFDATTRAPLACFRTEAGFGGARQAHATFPAPNDQFVLVANQNGRKVERIETNYATNTFTHVAAATLNLATCTTPNGVPCEGPTTRPSGIPICGIIDSKSSLAFITLRDGGLLVVDPRTNPISIVGEYDKDTIHGNGCGGIEAGKPSRIFINSGGPALGTLTNKSEFDVYRLPIDGYSPSNPPNTPAPEVVFSDDSYVPPTGFCENGGVADKNCRDAHGMALLRNARFLWVGDRHRGVFEVFDVLNASRRTTVDLVSPLSADPAPDLMDISPTGNRIFIATRGPNPLSGDPHVAKGDAPGLLVVQPKEGGKQGTVNAIVRISNIDSGGVERADAHGIRVRTVAKK